MTGGAGGGDLSKDVRSLVHVGYQKTATTFLQGAIFSRADFGLGLAGGDRGRAQLIEETILADHFVFDAEAAGGRLRALEAEQRSIGLRPVWSEEELLGDPLARRYDGHENLTKLAQAMPLAKILITIREQKAIALSMYREYVREGGLVPLRDFIGTGHEPPGYTPILRPHFLKYDRAVRFCHGLFGAENVLVLPQELLSRDAPAYYERLSLFLGVDVKPISTERGFRVGRSLIATAANRLLNRLAVRSPLAHRQSAGFRLKDRTVAALDKLAPPALSRSLEERYRRHIEETYRSRFTESNAALADLIQLDLRKLGYE